MGVGRGMRSAYDRAKSGGRGRTSGVGFARTAVLCAWECALVLGSTRSEHWVVMVFRLEGCAVLLIRADFARPGQRWRLWFYCAMCSWFLL